MNQNSAATELEKMVGGLTSQWRTPMTIFGAASTALGLGLVDIAVLLYFLDVWFWFTCIRAALRANAKRKTSTILRNLPKEIDIARNQLKESIASRIIGKGKDKSHFHVIVGTSGAGKTKLINNQLLETIELPKRFTSRRKIRLDKYRQTEADLLREIKQAYPENEFPGVSGAPDVFVAIKEIPSTSFALFIFDQFESAFSTGPVSEVSVAPNVTTSPADGAEIAPTNGTSSQLVSLCRIFDHCTRSNIRCILITRKEGFYNLKLFDKHISNFKIVHVVEGIDRQEEDQAWKLLRSEIQTYLRDESIICPIIKDCQRSSVSEQLYASSCEKLMTPASSRNQILPVELVTVAKALWIYKEIEKENLDQNVYEFLGERRGLVGKYFDFLLNESPSRSDSARVLYCLSVEPRGKRSLKRIEIENITNLSKERVADVLKSFCEQEGSAGILESSMSQESQKTKNRLLREDNLEVDWKHDFFAERFNEISASLLDPIDRDNIGYFWRQKQMGTIYPPSNEQENHRSDNVGFILFVLSFLCLTLWTFNPLIAKWLAPWGAVNQFFRPLYEIEGLNAPNIELSFLPILFALTYWSWYVTTVFRRVLSRLDESKVASLFSYVVAIWSLVLVGLSIKYPHCWIIFTGLGGMLVGLKYMLLAKATGRKLIEIRFGTMGKETFWNSLFMALFFGPAYAFMFPPNSFLHEPSGNILAVVSCVVMSIMLYFAHLAYTNHVGKDKVPILIGTYKRYRQLFSQK